VIRRAIERFLAKDLRSWIHENEQIEDPRLPGEMRRMRPDIVFERSRKSIGRRSRRRGNEDESGIDAAERGEQRMAEIIEFSCPYGYISQRRDSLKHAYKEKKRKYAELAKELKTQRGENVRVTAVIVSSMGAVYLPSLKDLQKVLKCSDEELRQLGRKMSETVIAGSMEIW
jgi:hypothetical protein